MNGNKEKVTSRNEIFSEREWMQIVKDLYLSPRQEEILKCLFLGDSDKQIAMDLQISIPTVRTHLSRLFLKFDVQDRMELILYIFRKFRENSQAKMAS
ncbi:MAG: response regulator transcription factor [Dehalococcoidia bacterium]|nr:MAG: response regulator transcription factor [Dehalococcoidia bacterium]